MCECEWKNGETCRGCGEANKHGLSVTPSFELPESYELREDAHFLYLYEGNSFRAVFNNTVTVEEIKKAIDRIQEARG